jgi:hypothetical protein
MKMELKIESTFENYPTLEKTLGKSFLGENHIIAI